eukprot:SM000096S24856  [mRNA]  locus=s96:176564:182351:+ [translate_table: standard]
MVGPAARAWALERLPELARDCLAKHLPASAAFFADKAVTLSGGAPEHVYLLAEAHHAGGHHRRALQLLRQRGLLRANIRFRYLAAKCLLIKRHTYCNQKDGMPTSPDFAAKAGLSSTVNASFTASQQLHMNEASKDWEECLAMLGEDMDVEEDNGALYDDGRAGREIDIVAAACLLRGNAYHALDNRAKATYWYRSAIQRDPYCFEALDQLFSNHMLTGKEGISMSAYATMLNKASVWLVSLFQLTEQDLLAAIHLGPHDDWLLILYSLQAKKYGEVEVIEKKFAELEASIDNEALERDRGAESTSTSMSTNGIVISCRADLHFQRGEYQCCYDITKRALSWFGVACYYYCIQHFDQARRYFSKATTLQSSFAPAWLGFGNAYAAQDESDQAMAAYRTAARLFAGCHLPMLCIGMEYQRTNNWVLAEQFYIQSRSICPEDPLVHNELGVLAFLNGDYPSAASSFAKALQFAPHPTTPAWETTLVNLAHTFRKQKLYKEAITVYEEAIALVPKAGAHWAQNLKIMSHMSACSQMQLQFEVTALGHGPGDAFATEMLTQALTEECQQSAGSDLDATLKIPALTV